MVPNILNQQTVSSLPIWRENEGPIRKKVIWLRKVIKPIVCDRCKILLRIFWKQGTNAKSLFSWITEIRMDEFIELMKEHNLETLGLFV